jgi:hypothetical protein
MGTQSVGVVKDGRQPPIDSLLAGYSQPESKRGRKRIACWADYTHSWGGALFSGTVKDICGSQLVAYLISTHTVVKYLPTSLAQTEEKFLSRPRRIHRNKKTFLALRDNSLVPNWCSRLNSRSTGTASFQIGAGRHYQIKCGRGTLISNLQVAF